MSEIQSLHEVIHENVIPFLMVLLFVVAVLLPLIGENRSPKRLAWESLSIGFFTLTLGVAIALYGGFGLILGLNWGDLVRALIGVGMIYVGGRTAYRSFENI